MIGTRSGYPSTMHRTFVSMVVAIGFGLFGAPALAAPNESDVAIVAPLVTEENAAPEDATDDSEPSDSEESTDNNEDSEDNEDNDDNADDEGEDSEDSDNSDGGGPPVTFTPTPDPEPTPAETLAPVAEEPGTDNALWGWALLAGSLLCAAAAYMLYRRDRDVY